MTKKVVKVLSTLSNEELVDELSSVRINKKHYEDQEKKIRTELVTRFKESRISNLKTVDVDFSVTQRTNETFLEEAFIHAIETQDEFKELKDLIIVEQVKKINFDVLEEKITLGEIKGDRLNAFNEVKPPTYVLNTKIIKKEK